LVFDHHCQDGAARSKGSTALFLTCCARKRQTTLGANRPLNVLQKPRKNIAATHRQQLDDLCIWIDAHIGEAISWQQLMEQSGLDFQTLQILFFQYKSATPMTWIRRRREVARSKLR